MNKTKIFISRSWAYSKSYYDLMFFLSNREDYIFEEYEIPKGEPFELVSSDNYINIIKERIEKQMADCNAFIVVSGKNAHYSDTIDLELEVAKRLKKPIIAVCPYESSVDFSNVEKNADEVIGWDINEIINVISKYQCNNVGN